MLKISVSIYHFPTPNGFCVGTWQRSSVTGAPGCPAPCPLCHCHSTPCWQNVTQRASAAAWPLLSAGLVAVPAVRVSFVPWARRAPALLSPPPLPAGTGTARRVSSGTVARCRRCHGASTAVGPGPCGCGAHGHSRRGESLLPGWCCRSCRRDEKPPAAMQITYKHRSGEAPVAHPSGAAATGAPGATI